MFADTAFARYACMEPSGKQPCREGGGGGGAKKFTINSIIFLTSDNYFYLNSVDIP